MLQTYLIIQTIADFGCAHVFSIILRKPAYPSEERGELEGQSSRSPHNLSQNFAQMPRNIYQLRNAFVNFYLIEWDNDLVLIDGGFIAGIYKLKQQLKSINKTFTDINHILLTHGHLDHTANITRIKELSDAPVVGHPKDKAHIAGNYPYTGSARVCGALEAIGRTLINYKPFALDLEVCDNKRLEIAGGMRVIHLPGHTTGHCGYYHEPTGILFSGDFFQCSPLRDGVAPFFLNSCPENFPSSIEKIIQLNPKGIYSNHCDESSPKKQFERFSRFVSRLPNKKQKHQLVAHYRLRAANEHVSYLHILFLFYYLRARVAFYFMKPFRLAILLIFVHINLQAQFYETPIGFGKNATGGAGGNNYIVTNLNTPAPEVCRQAWKAHHR